MHLKIKSWPVIGGALLLVVLGGGLTWFKLHPTRPLPEAPIEVPVIHPQSTLWQKSTQFVGYLDQVQGADLSAETEGRVLAIPFSPGQIVKAGAPLFVIDNSVLLAAVASNTANLKASQSNYARIQKLHQQSFASDADLEVAQKAFEFDQAALQESQAKLKQATVTAPFEGRAGLSAIKVGDYVTPGTALTHLSPIADYRIKFSVPANLLSSLDTQKDLQIQIKGETQTYPARIEATDTQVDAKQQNIKVWAQFKSAPKIQLMTGQYVTVQAYFGTPKAALILPENALNYAFSGSFVYAIVNGKTETKPVQILERQNQQLILTGQFGVSDEVVAPISPHLRDNMSVTPKLETTS